MKKFLLTIACTAVAALTFGQKDISVTTNSPVDNAPYNGGDLLSVEITVENTGSVDVNLATDTVYFFLSSGQSVLAATSLETYLPAVFAAGASETITLTDIFQMPENVASDTYSFCSNVIIFSDTVVTESDDQNNFSCFLIDLTTTASTEDVDVNVSNVYPNPATSVVNFELSQGAVEIVIYDVNGKAVKTQTVENTLETVNVADLENGVYFYAVTFENGAVKQERIVVSK